MRKIILSTSEYFLEPDTPVDLLDFKRNPSMYYKKFREHMYKGIVEISEDTYKKVKELMEKTSKRIFGWQLNLPSYERIKKFTTYYTDFKQTFKKALDEEGIDKKSIIIFVGRSSLPLIPVVSNYLEERVEKGDFVAALRSRHESKGGLREGIASSGLKYISKLIDRNNIKTAIIVDDIANTGKTLKTIGKEIRRKTKVIGVVAILNYVSYLRVSKNRMFFRKKLNKYVSRKDMRSIIEKELLNEEDKLSVYDFSLYPSQAVIAKGVQSFTHGFGDFIEEIYEKRKIKCLKKSEIELLNKTLEEIQLYKAFKEPVRRLVEELEYILFVPPTR